MKNQLKKVREASGKRQDEVASDLGISLSTYRSWEQGKRDLNGKKLLILSEYYSCTADTIIGNEYSEEISTPNESVDAQEKQLLHYFRGMTEHCKESFLTHAQLCYEVCQEK